MAVPPEFDKTFAIVQRAKELGWIISVDVNLRPRLATDLNAYINAVKELAQKADWLKASDEDLQLLGFHDASFDDAEKISDHWMKLGCQRVALTFGEHGAFLRVGSEYFSAQAPKIELVDTVGAGDTFWGTCIADWLACNDVRDDLQAQKRLRLTLHKALCAAAINCTRKGCQPPKLEELI
jgi:fructokinase